MKRRSRSGTADHSSELDRLSAFELDEEIRRCLWGSENAGTTQARKSYFKRLVWLEGAREERFGVDAPQRAFRER